MITRFLIAAGLIFGPTTALADAPDPDQVRIAGLSYAGSGCPSGTAFADVAADGQAFTVAFDQFVAEAGPGVSFSDSRKNCRLLVDLRFPQGWSYTIFRVDYRGFAALERGTWGLQRSYYYFQGRLQQVPLRSRLYGPHNDDYVISDTLGLDALVWHPCGAQRALNIDASVQVRANWGRRAFMTIDSIDGEVEHTYHIRWRRCPS